MDGNMRQQMIRLCTIRNSVESRRTWSSTSYHVLSGDGYSHDDETEPVRTDNHIHPLGCRHIYSRAERREAATELKRVLRTSPDPDARDFARRALRHCRLRSWVQRNHVAAILAGPGLARKPCDLGRGAGRLG
jgi:hypothetical protein